MTVEQENTIKLLIDDLKADEKIIGVLLIGSLANNSGNSNSDVDLYIIVKEETFIEYKKKKQYYWGTNFHSNKYPVEVEAKIIDKEYIKNIWINGTESSQNTFINNKILFIKDNELKQLLTKETLKEIPDKEEKIKKFYALMKSNMFKATDDLNNIFQLKKCVYDTVYFACRLVLTHNDILFPCIKNMEKALNKCKKMPKEFIIQAHRVLERYSLEDLEIFYNNTNNFFKEYQYDDKIRKGYVIENEEYWYFNAKPYYGL
jgi:predicted nucleotidyltransferase